VTSDERAQLSPEIALHEPPGALFAGADGLDVIRPLIAQARRMRAPLLALEVGHAQARAARELLACAGFRDIEARRDLAGIERVVMGRR
jgi:release factor glutamine methyltransferase